MLNVDEKAMAYCLIEALFAAGLLNLPTYQNFLRMRRKNRLQRLRKRQREALVENSARAFLFILKSQNVEVKYASSSICACLNRT